MIGPLINILIRSHRPEQFKICLRSVVDCGYENINVIVKDGTGYADNFRYNLLCNSLKQAVVNGYLFFLDDDDTLIPGALSKIASYLQPDRAVICQMLRNGSPKPKYNHIKRGRIGLPCMILHHSHKNIADITQHEGGDYDWIKSVTDKIPYKFVPVPLVSSPKRNYGR